jgi:DNA-binding CsgD family transcriptional regulator
VTLTEHLQALGVDLDPAFEKLDAIVYLMDRSGTVLWQNAAAIAYAGDWRGRRFFGAVAPEYRHRSQASFARQVLGVEGSVTLKTVGLGPDGERRPVQVQRIPLVNEEGVAGVLAIAQNIADEVVVGDAPRLTPRQHEVLRLLAEGRSTEEIAAELGVARETARNHIRRLLRAFGAGSRLQAVVRARELGLLE